ncbi:MAG: site-specific integrase [Deltaproteobacteria bacterium]|nr:site-specific integrase [Deltaproteobacteria bacterium]
MGLLAECPECKKRNSQKVKTCKCGFSLAKFSGRVWWIEYYDHDKRLRRERIGPNKEAAEHRLREVMSARTEGRYIKKSPDTKNTFKDLAAWYLELPEVKVKRSYDRDRLTITRLLPHFGARFLKDVTPAMVEAYKQARLVEPSGRTPQYLTKPATVNRELACLKTIFNKAVKNGKAEKNPAHGVKLLKENNDRDRVLSSEEYVRLLAHCPAHLKPVVKLAYHTGIRQGEILGLTWGQVDLKEGFIRLNPEDTKTNEARLVPLNQELIEMFKGMRVALGGVPLQGVKVFYYQGRSVVSIRKAFLNACQKAGIEDFTFHDLRHTFINNRRLEGHDYFRIMAATGHKTMSVFKRYNTVSKEELKALVSENR